MHHRLAIKHHVHDTLYFFSGDARGDFKWGLQSHSHRASPVSL